MQVEKEKNNPSIIKCGLQPMGMKEYKVEGDWCFIFFYMPGMFFLLSPSFFFHNRLCTVHPLYDFIALQAEPVKNV